MSKKGPLGRGLDALIEPGDAGDIREIDVDSIEPNPYQPRKTFDKEKLDDLVNSIRRQGILQPIVVTHVRGDKYQIVVGERRWRAARQLEMQKIPALIRKMNRKELVEAALVENIQREDLNPLELAEGYKRLMNEFTYTQEELSEVVGKSRSSVANTMRLLKLSDAIQDEIRKGTVSEGHARALLSVENLKERDRLFKKMLQEKLTVRKVEKSARKKKAKDVNLVDIEQRLTQSLKTKVQVTGRKKKGKLVIEYYSMEQLEGLIEKLEG